MQLNLLQLFNCSIKLLRVTQCSYGDIHLLLNPVVILVCKPTPNPKLLVG